MNAAGIPAAVESIQAEVQYRPRAGFGLASALAFEAQLHHVLAGSFHHPWSDRPALSPEQIGPAPIQWTPRMQG